MLLICPTFSNPLLPFCSFSFSQQKEAVIEHMMRSMKTFMAQSGTNEQQVNPKCKIP